MGFVVLSLVEVFRPQTLEFHVELLLVFVGVLGLISLFLLVFFGGGKFRLKLRLQASERTPAALRLWGLWGWP